MKKFGNFCRALDNLKAIYDYDEPYDNIIMSGMVNLFQICYEQSWKAVKEVLEQNGFTGMQTGSPRQVIKTAYQAHIIKDENAWLNAI